MASTRTLSPCIIINLPSTKALHQSSASAPANLLSFHNPVLHLHRHGALSKIPGKFSICHAQVCISSLSFSLLKLASSLLTSERVLSWIMVQLVKTLMKLAKHLLMLGKVLMWPWTILVMTKMTQRAVWTCWSDSCKPCSRKSQSAPRKALATSCPLLYHPNWYFSV